MLLDLPWEGPQSRNLQAVRQPVEQSHIQVLQRRRNRTQLLANGPQRLFLPAKRDQRQRARDPAADSTNRSAKGHAFPAASYGINTVPAAALPPTIAADLPATARGDHIRNRRDSNRYRDTHMRTHDNGRSSRLRQRPGVL